MIKGIGLDIVEIDRIEKAMKRTDKFKDRILTVKEKNYLMVIQKLVK